MPSLKHTIIFLSILISFTFLSFSIDRSSFDNNFSAAVILDYNVYAIPMPEELEFSGESVPLNVPDIKERMDRELLVNAYWQSNGFLMFKRANKYFPIIEPILESYGVPDDFKYLAMIESGLQNVTSPAGAKGFWQIMKSTGREYGLEINSNVDERYNLVLSTKAACEYLIKAKKKYGSWTLSAAAYNAGMNRISSELERQAVDNYYDMLLEQETGRYIFRIVAVKEIINNPKKYGFNFSEIDLYSYPITHTVKVDTAVKDLVKFAEKFNLNYKQLKLHNPWLKETFLNNKSKKKYYIEIPQSTYYNPND